MLVYKACELQNPLNKGDNMIKIVFNRLLGAWYIVRGAHHTPIGGRFESKQAAQAWLARDR
jgi:hypothetical protein